MDGNARFPGGGGGGGSEIGSEAFGGDGAWNSAERKRRGGSGRVRASE
jgi:hypothetical protein